MKQDEKTGIEYIKTGRDLAEARIKARCTQVELAVVSGVEQPNICAMERGAREISPEMEARLLVALRGFQSRYLERLEEADRLAESVFNRPHLRSLRRRVYHDEEEE